MTDKNYLNLLEYKKFLTHFNTNPFTIYNFTCIPLDCHVQELLTLQPSYYNSFYIVSLLKAYFSETKEIGEIETIQELATRIFRFEDKEDLLVSHDTANSLEITGMDAKNEICNIVKLLTMLNDYQSDECRQKIEFITNSILVMECVDFQYKLLFLEAFVTSVDTVVLYKNIVYRTLSFLSTLDFTVYLNEKNSEDDLNFNIDYLEICLYIANIYLEKKDTIEFQNHNATVPKTVLEEQVDVLYEVKIKEMEEINIEHQHFAFSTTFFDEAYALLTTSQVLEDDLFVIFKLTFSILILSTAHNDDNIVGQVIGKTMSSKEFMIREELMVDLQLQIIKCLYVIKNQQPSMQHLNLLLNSNAIVFLTKNNRARVISCLNRYEILSMDERIKIIRKAYFNIKLSLEDDKGKKVLSEERAGMLCVFLEYIGYSDSSFNFIEINNYFTSLSNYEESIEYYADFLSRNNFEAPLWTFLRSSETLYIIKFYMSFFKKVKRNYEQRRLKYENEKVDYSVIIDKHVTNFCKIFIERKDIDLANVLNAIPYLPEKPEYFAIYFHVWRFIFDNNAENEMQFFGYKTPALIKLSLGNDACTEINNHLLEKVVRLLGKERQDMLFSYDNIRKYYTDFQFVLILFIEREKIRNYMFDGIYGYINDTKLLKNGLESLIFVMKGIHYSFKIKYDILKEYLLKLLEIFLYSYESTKRVVFEILKLLLKNEKYLAFDLDINVKYNECIKSLKNGRKSKKSQALLSEIAQTYRTKFLDVIRNEAKILHDYLILFFCDIDLFAETKINGRGNFAEINAYVKLEMEKILSFSKNEYDKEITDVNERYQWLVDTAYMNRYDHTLIRQIITFLKFLLKENYCLDKLYVLIKIYNIIGIRDEDFEQFLKMAIHIPLNFNCKIGTIQRIYEETSDFYRYYFSQLLFLYSEYSTKIMAIPFPTKKGIYDIFTEEDIIFIQNMFQKKIIYDFLSVRNEKHHLRFFYNQNELSILDIVSIVRNSNDKELIRIALQRLKSCNIIKFVPQLVQCLQRKETFADVFLVLHKLCTDEHVCHFLLWNLKSNVATKGDIYSNCVKDIESTYGHRKVSEDKPGNENSTHEFLQEMQFFDELTDVSSQMMPYLKSPKEDKRLKINEFLSRINVPVGIFLPTNTEYDIVKIVPNSGRVLQSHAKVPFMASFYCVKRDLLTDDLRECIKNDLIDTSDQKESVIIQNLIFKAGDDCRQDILAIQLISMFKDIFEKNNLDLYLFPYQVIATGPETGIIEVIPNAITRDQMGREKINNLVDYFEYKFGFRESESYIKAVHNFTKSFAAYSLVTYFLNIKDRHNGNIMIDKDGHIIHIDFGYMFEISPGNMNLEIPIKLTREIHDLLLSSEMYDVYIDLMLKGFFVLRRNSKDIIFMVDSFKDSGLQCYKKKAVDNFIDRFKFKLTDDEAKIFVVSMVNNSVKRMRTWMYDKYQELTNNIAF